MTNLSHSELVDRAERLGLTRELYDRVDSAESLAQTHQWSTCLRKWITYRQRHELSPLEATVTVEAMAQNLAEQRARRISHDTGAT